VDPAPAEGIESRFFPVAANGAENAGLAFPVV